MNSRSRLGVVLSSILVFLLVLMPISLILFPSIDPEGKTNLAVISGEAQDDLFGWNVSGAGDMNFDGHTDFIVGAPGYDNQRGRAYVFLGGPAFSGVYSADSANITINGSSQGDLFGWDVAGKGDVNDDGYDDVIIGAPGNNSQSGAVYIFYGNNTFPKFFEASEADVTIYAETAGDKFGSSVSIAGDVNFDGYDDIIAGSPDAGGQSGAAHVFLGIAPFPVSLTTQSANLTLYGENPGDRFGHSVSGAGDVNNDDFDDIVVGAPGADKTYLYFGGDPMNSWVQTAQAEFGQGARLHTITESVYDGEIKLDTFYDIKAMMAYNGSYSNIPRIRTWDQNNWSAWSDSAAPDPDDNYWFVLESGTVRKNEKILGVLDSTQDVNVQVWDGMSWSPILELMDVSSNSNYRSFDIAYETQSGDAMIVYYNFSSGDLFPKFKIWNGTSWSSEQNTMGVGTADIYWVVLASNPISDEILLVTLDGNSDIYAQVWDGDAWGNVQVLETDSAVTQYQCFDAEFESQSGYGFIAWSDNLGSLDYRRWRGNWTEPEASWGTANGLISFLKLSSEVNSNHILMAQLNDNPEINATVWDGSTWGTPVTMTTGPTGSTRACFDVAWESKSDKKGLVAYAENNDAPRYRTVDGVIINSTVQTALDANPGDIGDPNWVILESDPQTDEIMMIYLVNDGLGAVDDIGSELWNGTSWIEEQNIELNSTRDIGPRFDLTYTDASGTFISTFLDSIVSTSWGRIKWNAYEPLGTTLKIRTRSSADNSTWSLWSNWYNNGDRITSPPDRYIQYQVWLETTNISLSPVLYDIRIELNRPDLVINGTTGEGLGWSLSDLGDLDGDNYDDVIIGAPQNNSATGSAYILLGSHITFEGNMDGFIDLENGDLANYTLVGESPGDEFGYSVASAGYFNNDAMSDVVIGAPNANGNGSVYVFFGGPSVPAFIPASACDFSMVGENMTDCLGWSVDRVGNVDNDTAGFHEFAIGVPYFDYGGNLDSGGVYVVHMFNQPDILIDGNGDDMYQVNPSVPQVNFTIIEAGSNGSWLIEIENDGSLNDTFDITFLSNSPGGWSWELRDNITWGVVSGGDSFPLEPKEMREFVLDINAPISAIHDDEMWVQLIITSQNDSSKMDTVSAFARVSDIIPPVILDTTSADPTTGDTFTISSQVNDNILLSEVFLYFWFNTTSGLTSPQNISLSDLGGGNFEYQITVPENALEIFYNISAHDSSNNWDQSGQNNRLVSDNDPPEIGNIVIDPPVQQMENSVNISVSVTDEFDVYIVKIYMSLPDGSYQLLDTAKISGNIWFYDHIYTETGMYNFTIWVNDSKDNQNESAPYSFNITIPPPTVDYIQIRSEPNEGGGVIKDMIYDRDDTDIFYAAGYNLTFGYIGEVEVSWSSTDSSGLIGPVLGFSTNFTAQYEGGGTIFAVYTLGIGIQNSTTFEIVFSETPEIIKTIPNIEIQEDWGLYQKDLSEFAYHPRGKSDLKWDITGVDESVIRIVSGSVNVPNQHVVSLITQDDMFGNMHVTYWLIYENENNVEYKVSQKAWINVTPKNDAPTISDCPNLNLRYDLPYSFDYTPYIRDIDNTLSQLTLDVQNSDHTTVNGFVVKYNYPVSMLGMEELVTLTVSDGDLKGSTLISVKITSNYPPEIIDPLSDITLFENEIVYSFFDLDNHFRDADDDKLAYSFENGLVDITINENNTVDFSAGEQSGTELVTFRATDILGAIVEQTIEVKVIPVNDPPEIEPIDTLRIRYNYNYTFDLVWYISDSDNSLEELEISTSNPDNVTINGTQLILLYPDTWEGNPFPYTTSLTIYVSDGFYNVTEEITIMVSDNFPPYIFSPMDDVFLFEDDRLDPAFDLDEHFSDLDGDPIFYTYGNNFINVIIYSDNTIAFVPDANWSGSELILIRATDNKGSFFEDFILVTVIPRNDAPTISGISPISVEYEKDWFLDLSEYIQDIDNDINDLNITVDSQYVEVVGRALRFNYPKSIKKDTVMITVSDGEFNTTISVPVTVTEPPVPPTELPWILILVTVILAALLVGALVTRIARYKIVEIFLITKSGMLIVHTGVHKEDDEKDKDIVASMFVAVQSFIKDAFAEDDTEALKRMDYGDKTVLINMGNSVLLTAFIKGQESKPFLKSMTEFIEHLEDRYKGSIEMWNGNYESLPDIDKILESFFNGSFKKEYLKPYENGVTTKEVTKKVGEIEEVEYGEPASLFDEHENQAVAGGEMDGLEGGEDEDLEYDQENKDAEEGEEGYEIDDMEEGDYDHDDGEVEGEENAGEDVEVDDEDEYYDDEGEYEEEEDIEEEEEVEEEDKDYDYDDEGWELR